MIACVYQTEVQVSDLHAAHTLVQEETRAEIKRVQSEASKDVSNLQSLLSFKVSSMDSIGLRMPLLAVYLGVVVSRSPKS